MKKLLKKQTRSITTEKKTDATSTKTDKLDSILVQNFQINKKVQLDLSIGLNVILGPTRNGKSSIIRGSRWIGFNRPSGFEFKNWDAEPEDITKVTFKIGQDRISRIRNDKLNKYMVNRESYKALGSDVPKEVQAVLDMNEINIQTQFEPFFMLQDTAGNVAKRLNSIVGLDIIDSSRVKVNTIVTQANSDVNQLEAELETETKKLLLYRDLDIISELVQELSDLDIQCTQVSIDASNLRSLLDKAVSAKDELKEFNWVKEAEECVIELKTICDDAFVNESRGRELYSLLDKAVSAKVEIEKFNELLKAEKEVQEIKRTRDSLKVYQNNKESLQKLISQASTHINSIDAENERITDLESAIQTLLNELGICPTCGSKI